MDRWMYDDFETPSANSQSIDYSKQAYEARNKFDHTDIKLFKVIAAVSKENNGIGIKGKLPWSIPEDMVFFKKTTTQIDDTEGLANGTIQQNAVIMGKNTFESMNYKPLKSRWNIVVSRSANQADYQFDNLAFVKEFEDALKLASDLKCENVFVIGGQQLYNEAVWHGRCSEVIINEIEGEYDCDTFFPNFFNENIYKLYDETILSNNVTSKKYVRRWVYTDASGNLVE